MSLIYIFLRRIIEKKLRKKFTGNLKIIFPDNYEILLGEEKDAIIVHIYKNIFILRIFFCSFSEYGYSYAKGEWGTNNLAKFLELALLNMPLIKEILKNYWLKNIMLTLMLFVFIMEQLIFLIK